MLEVRALAKATEALRQSQDIRKGLPRAVVILSMVGQRHKLTHDMKEAADALHRMLASSAVTLRQISADAQGQGTLVWRIGIKGREAAVEIDAAFTELLGEVMAGAGGKAVAARVGRDRRRANPKRRSRTSSSRRSSPGSASRATSTEHGPPVLLAGPGPDEGSAETQGGCFPGKRAEWNSSKPSGPGADSRG